MFAEILTIGDEIRSGACVDSNSACIAQKLEAAGIEVVRHNCVGEDGTVIVSVLKEIGHRSDLAVVTGGLGPRDNDLTAGAAAKAAGVDTVLHQKALESIKKYLIIRQRPFLQSYKKQAILPDGAECLSNSIGTAPGFGLQIAQCEFFFLPDVPVEMQQMLADQIIPRVVSMQKGNVGIHLVKTISVFGLTESTAGKRLIEFKPLFPQIKIGFRTKFPEIQLKLYADGTDINRISDYLREATEWIGRRLGDTVFSDNGEPMEQVVGNHLRRKNATLAVAESCTGGLIADLLTDVPGSSDYFLFSAVTYTNQSKMTILDVAAETLDNHGAVAEQTAKEMALGAKHACGATYGLATSGIAGPGGGTDDKPVGTVCIGLATPFSAAAHRFNFTNPSRRMNKQIFAVTALDILRKELLNL